MNRLVKEKRSKSSCFCAYFTKVFNQNSSATEKISPSDEQNQISWWPNSYSDIWSLDASKSPMVTVKPANFGLFPHRHGLLWQLNRERRPFVAPVRSFIDVGRLERFCAQGSKVRVSHITRSERLIDRSVGKVRPPLPVDAGTREQLFCLWCWWALEQFSGFFKKQKQEWSLIRKGGILKDGRSDLVRKKSRDQRPDQEETFVLLLESFYYTQMIFSPSLLFNLRCLNELSVKSLIRFFSFSRKLWQVWTGTVTWPYSPIKPMILLFPLTYFFATASPLLTFPSPMCVNSLRPGNVSMWEQYRTPCCSSSSLPLVCWRLQWLSAAPWGSRMSCAEIASKN